MADYFDDYFFTSNFSGHVCPGFGTFQCQPPNGCARDGRTGKRYCCDYGDVCWTTTSPCASDGSTLDCGSGETTWCCLFKTEVCTQTTNQINICWSSAHDTLNNISAKVLNQTFSSLSSAKPSASSWSFDPLVLIAATQTSSTGTTSTATSPATTSSPAASSPGSSDSPGSASTPISGGVIGGIAVGAAAGIALLALAIYLIVRRSRRRRVLAQAGTTTFDPKWQAASLSQTPQELPEGARHLEMQGSQTYGLPPQELPADSPTFRRNPS